MNRERILSGVAVIAVLVAALLGYLFYQQKRTANLEEQAAQKAAENVAKAENPFKSDNPLADVETDPLGKVKKVLNPFEQ